MDLESIITPESLSPGFSTWSLFDGAESTYFSRSTTTDGKVEGSSDALPEASNGFEWNENEDFATALSDGMAALSVDPQGVGFLGKMFLRN